MPEKSLQLYRAALGSQMLGGFSASELGEALSIQESNSDWIYCYMKINGFDYSSRMSSLYMFKTTWLVAWFPESQSKRILHSFFHTARAAAVNIFSICRARGNKPKPSLLWHLLVVIVTSRKIFFFREIRSPRSNVR